LDCHFVKPDGTRISSEFIAIESIDQDGTPDHEFFTLVTKRPHHRDVGPGGKVINNVLIFGVASTNNLLSGSFHVVEKVSETVLVFKVPGAPPGMAITVGAFAGMGVDFHGPFAFSGTGCVTEGNAVYDCFRPLYTDTGSARDLVVRDNYYSNITRAIDFDFNPISGGVSGSREAASLTHGGAEGKTATFTMPSGTPPLEISVGDAVTIAGARIGTILANDTYNGTFTVLSVSPDNRQFTSQ